MASDALNLPSGKPIRRAPPDFSYLTVDEVERHTSRFVSVRLSGAGLKGVEAPGVGASLRLLVPAAASESVELPYWTGNEFLFADNTRPPIRTLTPVALDAATGSVNVHVLCHGPSHLGLWAQQVVVGNQVAFSGPGRGFDIPADRRLVVIGDESAIPAIGQLVGAAQPQIEAVIVESGASDSTEMIDLVARGDDAYQGPFAARYEQVVPGPEEGTALAEYVRGLGPELDGRFVWAAGQAASVQAVRKHLAGIGVPRIDTNVRGYWK